MTKKTYKVSGMHCTSCALMIESDLEDVGVVARCSYAKQILDVEFDDAKVSEQKIKDTVKQTGYSIA